MGSLSTNHPLVNNTPQSPHPHPLPTLLQLAHAAFGLLEERRDDRALLSQVRGSDLGISFRAAVRAVFAAIPRPLESPFEGSHHVSGAAWPPGDLGEERIGFLRLRFAPHTTDLPPHTHDTSHRFITVLRGRGRFHTVDPATGEESFIVVRERDALLFRAGTIHTFTTGTDPLELLSLHDPFLPLADPLQYTLSRDGDGRPRMPAVPSPDLSPPRVTLDPNWRGLLTR